MESTAEILSLSPPYHYHLFTPHIFSLVNFSLLLGKSGGNGFVGSVHQKRGRQVWLVVSLAVCKQNSMDRVRLRESVL